MSLNKLDILNKIEKKEVEVAVIGLGYVGLPLLVECAKSGYRSVGFDLSIYKTEVINAGQCYIEDINPDVFEKSFSSGLLKASHNIQDIKDAGIIFVCVPTPLDSFFQPDLSFVEGSMDALSLQLKKGDVIILVSTTYPGTTNELVMPILEKGSGLKCGEDFYLGYSPERVDPGNTLYQTANTPRVVGGVTTDATEIIGAFMRNVITAEVITVENPAVAEMEKILENTFRNINIALINEISVICNKMKINVWEVIEAAKSKPYGFMAFYPGPGIGGHCIPLDPSYLSWKSKQYGYTMRLVETANDINRYMPEYTVERCYRILNEYKKPVKDSRILLYGVAYKPDISDMRESPAVNIINILNDNGAQIYIYDKHVKKYVTEDTVYESIPDPDLDDLKSYDLIIIITAHSGVDYELLSQAGVPVFDCRNACKHAKDKSHIILL